jgi:hypothetical protein
MQVLRMSTVKYIRPSGRERNNHVIENENLRTKKGQKNKHWRHESGNKRERETDKI